MLPRRVVILHLPVVHVHSVVITSSADNHLLNARVVDEALHIVQEVCVRHDLFGELIAASKFSCRADHLVTQAAQ